MFPAASQPHQQRRCSPTSSSSPDPAAFSSLRHSRLCCSQALLCPLLQPPATISLSPPALPSSRASLPLSPPASLLSHSSIAALVGFRCLVATQPRRCLPYRSSCPPLPTLTVDVVFFLPRPSSTLEPSSSYASSPQPATAANCRPQLLPSPPISSASCGFSTHCCHCCNLPFLISCRSSCTSSLPSPSVASSSVGHLCSSLPSAVIQPLPTTAIFPRSHSRPPLQCLHLASFVVGQEQRVNFFLIPLEDIEIVLGIEWLSTLGDVT
ncbi:hypothetical protein BHE74_00032937 [Ensete ventricosum]|nr:hypothetical protein BHE74_00032937 [Ensete ventricosum]